MPFQATLLQKLKSFFFPVTIEITKSTFNPYLEVLLVNNKLQLNTNNACYSYEDKYSSFAFAFKKIQLENYSINKVLVLGGGLCSIPQLVQIYHPQASFDIVEIDKAIIDLAKRFTKGIVKDACNFIEKDALSFIQTNTKQYDLICIDIFIDDKVPEKFLSEDFFQHIKRANSTQNSWVIMSTLPDATSKETSDIQYFNRFSTIFKNSQFIKAGANQMFVFNQKGK